MSNKAKLALITAIFLWASAYVAIRVGLHGYSPTGLALLRYLIASICMGVIYYRLPKHASMGWRDTLGMLIAGAIGIGIYNVTLNYGEVSMDSGIASFFTSQSPIITAIFALIFLGERPNKARVLGFIISILGIGLIALGEKGSFHWDAGFIYILAATITGSCYHIFQKPYLKKYHGIEATTYFIWGGTLFLLIYLPNLRHDLAHAPALATWTAIYLGVFPATIGYVAWSYVLSEMSVARAASFLYFMPFIATLLGWLCLGEAPIWLSLAGGVLAIIGVIVVNYSYRLKVKPDTI